MSASPTFQMLSVAEFTRIPDPPGGRYELHHGEPVFVTFPVKQHKDLQRRLRKMLEPLLEPAGYIVDTEYAYRPFREYEVWGADIACVHTRRDASVESWLDGSPELVIEVKWPSNTRRQLNDKARTTLAGNGAVEFWIVYPQTCKVAVFKRTGSAEYTSNDSIPVPLVDNAHLRVDDIFAGIA